MGGLDEFAVKKYLNLESYRRTGAGVRTPVWFAAEGSTLYVYSMAHSGKAKRIRRSEVVKIAPCDARGKVTGPWVEARARLVEGATFDRGMALIDRKYWPVKQMLDLATRLFSRHQRVMIAIEAV